MKSFFLVLILSMSVSAAAVKSSRTEFQKEIALCLPSLKKIEGLKSFEGLMSSIESQFLVVTEQNIYREVQFEKESKLQKLKLTRDQLELYDIDAEGRLTSAEVEPLGKSKSFSRQIGQILHRAKITYDWHKTRETREGSLTLEIVRKDSAIVQLLIENRSLKSKLDCNTLETSQVCICHK